MTFREVKRKHRAQYFQHLRSTSLRVQKRFIVVYCCIWSLDVLGSVKQLLKTRDTQRHISI